MSDALKRAIRTAIQTWLGVYFLTLTPWLAAVSDWATGDDLAFPSVNPLAKALVAGLAAAAAGLVSWTQNALEDSSFPWPPFLKDEQGRHEAP